MLKIIKKKWWLLLVCLGFAYICALISTSCAIKRPLLSTTSSNAPAVATVYEVCYLAEDGGEILGETKQIILEGKNTTAVSASARQGYKFIGWSDGVTDTTRIDSNIVADMSVTAYFERLIFTVNYKATEGGRIEGLDNQQVEYLGDANLVTAIPHEGYKFIGWSDGFGEAIRNDNNITTDLNITAEFRFLYAGGSGSVEDPYKIETYSQLKDMVYYPEKNYKLIADLYLDGINHEPIFSDELPFNGKFQGDGHKINNLFVKSECNFPSLFGFIGVNGIVTAVELVDAYVVAENYNTQTNGENYYIGTLAGVSMGFLDNIIVSGSILVDQLYYDGISIGGLVGMAYATISDCHSDVQISVEEIRREHNTSISCPFVLGGLIGVGDSTYIRNSVSKGKIKITESTEDVILGGLVGYYFTSYNAKTYIKNCFSNIDIFGANSAYVGGVLGRLDISASTELNIQKSTFNGSIEAYDCAGFLFIGTALEDSNLLIEGCNVEGVIRANHRATGFVQNFAGYEAQINIQNCRVVAGVEAINGTDDSAYCAATGFCGDVAFVNIYNCYFKGTVKAKYCYGFVGVVINQGKISSCFAEVTMLADIFKQSAAFAYSAIKSEIENCYCILNDSGFLSGNALLIIKFLQDSSVSNFYYDGYWSGVAISVIQNSSLNNCHLLKGVMESSVLVGRESGTENQINVILYNFRKDMFNLADILDKGNLEKIWVNVEDNTPKLCFALASNY